MQQNQNYWWRKMSINHQELVQPIEDPAGNLIGIFVPYITRINSKNAVGRLITNATLKGYLSIWKISPVNSAKRTFTNNKFLTKAICCTLERSNCVWCGSYRGLHLLYRSTFYSYPLNCHIFCWTRLEICNNSSTFYPLLLHLRSYWKHKTQKKSWTG